jgi:hypothetical protein
VKQVFQGWWVVAGVFVMLTVTAGFGFYGLPVYLRALTLEQGFSVGAVSGATAVFFLVSGLVGIPVAGWMTRHDPRPLVAVGALTCGLALALLGRVSEVWHVYVAYALFGAGFAASSLVPGTTLVTRWFSRRRSVTLSIASTGLSAGACSSPRSSPPRSRTGPLADVAGWLGLAVVVGVVPVTTWLLRRRPRRSACARTATRRRPRAARPPFLGESAATALRSRYYACVTGAHLLAMLAQVGGIAHLYNLVAERRDVALAATAIQLLAVSSLVGRLLGGLVAERTSMRGLAIVLMVGRCWRCAPSPCSTAAALLVTTVGFGLTVGNLLMLHPLLLAARFGVADYGRIYSRSQLVATLGVAGGPLFIGALHDVVDGYGIAFAVRGGASLVAAGVLAVSGPTRVPRRPEPPSSWHPQHPGAVDATKSRRGGPWQARPHDSAEPVGECQGEHVPGVGDPGDVAPVRGVGRRQPGAGLPGLRLSAGAQGRGEGRHRRRRQPVRHHLGSEGVPRRHRGQGRPDLPRLDGRPGDRALRHLRLHRGHDRHAARDGRPRRRGDRLRAVLRELRPRRGPVGATPRYVTLHAPDWSIDEAELRAAFSDRTRAIIVNTPHNPTGKVFTREELALISELCQTHDALVLTDEIYEHIVYDAEHVPPATVPGLEDRTVTINALSKTYAVTGWRVGLGDRAGRDHEQHPQGARLPHRRRRRPLQAAGAAAMALPPSYYTDSAAAYRERRDLLCSVLERPASRSASRRRLLRAVLDRLARPGAGQQRVRPPDRARPGHRRGPGTSFYADPKDGAGPDPLRVPEDARDAARRRRAHRGAARLARDVPGREPRPGDRQGDRDPPCLQDQPVDDAPGRHGIAQQVGEGQPLVGEQPRVQPRQLRDGVEDLARDRQHHGRRHGADGHLGEDRHGEADGGEPGERRGDVERDERGAPTAASGEMVVPDRSVTSPVGNSAHPTTRPTVATSSDAASAKATRAPYFTARTRARDTGTVSSSAGCRPAPRRRRRRRTRPRR